MVKNEQPPKIVNFTHLRKHKFTQNDENEKHENAKTCKNSPSDPPHVIFGLKTGSRGTPWNRKNAGPGGSDFTKCRFWSIIWHFGHFGGGVIFWPFFTLFHFSILSLFHDFDFLHFITFSLFLIFSILAFSCFVDFCQFLSLFYAVDQFLCLN